jgi:hypothetical protein
MIPMYPNQKSSYEGQAMLFACIVITGKVWRRTRCIRIWMECFAWIAIIPTGERISIFFNRKEKFIG